MFKVISESEEKAPKLPIHNVGGTISRVLHGLPLGRPDDHHRVTESVASETCAMERKMA